MSLASLIYFKASPHPIFLGLTEYGWLIFPIQQISQLPGYELLIHTQHFTSYSLLTGFPKTFLIGMTMCLFLHFSKAQLSSMCQNWQNFTELKSSADKHLKLPIRYHCTSQWLMVLHKGPFTYPVCYYETHQLTSHQWNTFDISTIWSQAPSTPLKCPW